MSPTSDRWRTIEAADDGESKRRNDDRKYKISMQTELNAIDQLSQRISYMAAAERRLDEVTPDRVCDPDLLRAAWLALNSALECIARVEDVACQVDLEMGQATPTITRNYEACEPTMDGLDGFASDLQFQVNSQSYMLGLIPSRRRPDLDSVHFMRYLIEEMRRVIESIGRRR